jgi:hypothetical protein
LHAQWIWRDDGIPNNQYPTPNINTPFSKETPRSFLDLATQRTVWRKRVRSIHQRSGEAEVALQASIMNPSSGGLSVNSTPNINTPCTNTTTKTVTK